MTWSVVAVDSRTGEVGVAVASCVPLDVVLDVPGIAAGRGALVTQSYLLHGERDHAVGLLGQGLAPEDVLARLVDPAFDPDFELRQLAIVGVDGRVASFTGRDAIAFAGHASSQRDGVTVAVQGNLLTGPEVVSAALEAAFDPSPCDLPARLLAALEAGGRDGRGDGRCTPLGRSSQSATLQAGRFELRVGAPRPGEGPEPLDALRTRFEATRATFPCPEREDTGASAGSSTAPSEAMTEEPPRDAAEADAGDGCGCSVSGADNGVEPALVLALLACVRCFRRRRRSGARRTRR